MKRLLSACLMMWLVAGLSACGKKEEPASPSTPPAAQAEAPAAAPATATPAEGAQPAAPATSAEGEAAQPAAQLSETADPVEPTETADTATQPSLRLGGPASEPASKHFQEGVNYKRVVPAQRTNVTADKVEVMEVFWYGCPHCYALDPAIEAWRHNGKPDFVEFSRVPAMWGPIQRTHARVFYTAELLGKLEQLHTKIFRAIQAEGNHMDSDDKIQAFFVSQGVSEADFKRAYSSFAVESKLKRAEMLGRAYRIDSVPTFTINGKYTTGVGDAGGEQQLFALLNEVATTEHGGR